MVGTKKNLVRRKWSESGRTGELLRASRSPGLMDGPGEGRGGSFCVVILININNKNKYFLKKKIIIKMG